VNSVVIEQSYDLAALPERVWAALTEPKRLAAWFMPNDLVPVVGERFTLRPGLPGLPGAIPGEVLAVGAGQSLRMGWDVAGEPVLVTWRVDAAPGGSALRVTRDSALADPVAEAAFEAALAHRYADPLRSFLRSGMRVLQVPPARNTPPVVSVADQPVSEAPARPVSGAFASVVSDVADRPVFIPVASARSPLLASRASLGSGSPARPTLPPTDRARRRSRQRLAVSAMIALVLAGGWWALGSPGFSGSRAPNVLGAGGGSTGSGPDGSLGTALGASGGVGSSHPATPPAGNSSTHPPVATSATSTTPALPALVVHEVVGAQTALSYHVTVTVSNPAAAPQAWRSVWLQLTGVSLSVSVASGPVRYAGGGCVVPTASSSTVGADATVTFVLAVTAVLPAQLGSVSGVALEDSHCGG
jgi:uncharacterized protein YndB with AHSA1/START domain